MKPGASLWCSGQGKVHLPSQRITRWGRLTFWAERGLVRCRDEETGEEDCFSVRTTLERLRGLQDMLKNSSRRKPFSADPMTADYQQRLQSFIEDMIAICRLAQEQGMPEDASARREWQRRRPKTLVMGGASW